MSKGASKSVPENEKESEELLELIKESEGNDEESLPDVVKEMERLYRKMSLKAFFKVYDRALIVSFSYKHNPRAVTVRRLLGMFVVRLIKNKLNGCEEFINLLFVTLRRAIANYILYVRKAACKFLAVFVEEPITLTKSLHIFICRKMIEKLLMEKDLELRKEAAKVLHPLQDSKNPRCPVLKCFYTLISGDYSNEIRKYLISLATITSQYLHVLILATRDIDEEVRVAAHIALKKLPITDFPRTKRTDLVFHGLFDSCGVKNVVKSLLKIWLESFENNHISLINSFDLSFKVPEVIDTLLNAIFEISDGRTLAKELSLLLKKDRVIPAEMLSLQNVLFWKHFLVFYANSMEEVTEYFNIPDKDSLVAEDVEITLFPDMMVLCSLIREYYLNDEGHDDPIATNINEKMNSFWYHYLRERTLGNLLNILELYDFSDEVGRKEMHVLLLDLLQHGKLERFSVSVITKLFLKTSLDIDEGITRIIKTVGYLCMKSISEESDEHTTSGEVLDSGEEHRAIIDTFRQRKSDREAIEFIRKIPKPVLERCMFMVLELMKSKLITTINSNLKLLLEEFVLSVLELYRDDSTIMSTCSVVLCSFCHRDSELAKKHINTFISLPSDCSASSAQCLFDMLLKYPLEELPPDEPLNITFEDSEKDQNLHPIFQFLLSLYDKKKDDPETIEECILGLCKMFLTRKTKSPTILSRIFLFYTDSERERYNHDLQVNIPVFFEAFSRHGEYAIGIFAKAFIITLEKILETNIEESIDHQDVEKFTQMMVKMINRVIDKCETKEILDEVMFQLVSDLFEQILKSKSPLINIILLNVIMELKVEHISEPKLRMIEEWLKSFEKMPRCGTDDDDKLHARKVISKIILLIGNSSNQEHPTDDDEENGEPREHDNELNEMGEDTSDEEGD